MPALRSLSGDEGSDYRLLIWLLIGLGTLARLILAFATPGEDFDMAAYRLVHSALRQDFLHVYAIANHNPVPLPAWPYPPGYFPAILGLGKVASVSGLQFTSLIRLPGIAADAAIAWLVQDYLGRRGASTLIRLVAVTLVALGPSFAADSAYHGQLDSLAILPAVAAVAVWERADGPWRSWGAGALIGVAASIKTPPLLLVLALLPSARSSREALRLAGCAVAIPAAALAPFVLAGGSGVDWVLRYHGGAGGGLSLLFSPAAPASALGLTHAPLSAVTRALLAHGQWIAGVAVAASTALLLRYRPPAIVGAVLLWLVVYAFGVTFFLQYMVWGLPFFLMAGYVRQVLVLEAALVPAILVIYGHPAHEWEVLALYTVPVLVVWAALTVSTFVVARGIVRLPRSRVGIPARDSRSAVATAPATEPAARGQS
jgi:hypothetical protein